MPELHETQAHKKTAWHSMYYMVIKVPSCGSGLPPQEAPVMIAKRRRLFLKKSFVSSYLCQLLQCPV